VIRDEKREPPLNDELCAVAFVPGGSGYRQKIKPLLSSRAKLRGKGTRLRECNEHHSARHSCRCRGADRGWCVSVGPTSAVGAAAQAIWA
jgi:hypothetical protein